MAYLWYLERNPEAARRLLDALSLADREIGANPVRWPLVGRGTEFRKFVLKDFPYLVVYRVARDGTAEVLTLHHARRNPDRLPH